MKAFLDPAAARGGVPVYEDGWAVWAVYDGDLKAAAATRLTFDGHGEIILCGGEGAREWAQALADRICDWFRSEGMGRAMIIGRKGWARLLTGWTQRGDGAATIFERAL